MPILQVKLSAAPTPALSRQVAAALVEITTRVLRKKPKITAVVLDYVASEHWLVGGASLAEQGKASFFLDIKIVDGTNTKDEKSHYQREVFARMGQLLGDLHPESYIYVHDVRAEAYGFGGLTQEFRYVQQQLQG